MRLFGLTMALLAAVIWGIPRASAETQEIRIAQQYGLLFLPLIILEKERLVEKHAQAAGLKDLKAVFIQVTGGNVMNEGLLSGNIDIASGGVPPFLTLWARTKGNADVKAIAAMCSMPIYLNTRAPHVKTIKDFTDGDRIAMPAVKVSIQAIMLQMAAEKIFGVGQHGRLDPLTVTLAHPLAMAALSSDKSEINSHFASPPYNYQELAIPGVHTVLNSYDVLGPATFEVIWTTSRFRAENPKTYATFLAAYKEAIDLINKDKRRAAEIFLRGSNEKLSMDDVIKILNDPQVEYTTAPKHINAYSDFMYRIGSIKSRPETWQDLFFPDLPEVQGALGP
jgi:NitT/TauT family transport system substrate-binding protein